MSTNRENQVHAHNHIRKEKQTPPFALVVRRGWLPWAGLPDFRTSEGVAARGALGGFPRPQLRGLPPRARLCPSLPKPPAWHSQAGSPFREGSQRECPWRWPEAACTTDRGHNTAQDFRPHQTPTGAPPRCPCLSQHVGEAACVPVLGSF